ncbi:dephospho-CoA kinase [Yersinia rochesterensis]|uniref:Dephospho-CoA kinase n=1 Tax=Yersinia rochesterensis TaxID=1604335 RepID=A0A386HB28_9GAMM|nr:MULTISPECIES: dephospho-CoA kinase [Yersinia]AJI87797.1 dephospho-CoA kinase [Yersinia frederiksenii Y225]CNH20090.1 dephospho-CoA kinase [Yersinia kristensenii]AIN17173.1 dephospho-CoA kinase [Yersinia rochesterensis]AJJ34091.1 dephospho-CoA kinase [Yersinia rochesterensis]AYD42952.1 dephospho-CoA kinase [Yersinia rochesterensis]
MTYIVALTGGIGSGKSTVADAFANLGVPRVDADIIARQVVEPGMPALAAIVSRYGEVILQADGALNRAVLREKIFSEPQEKAWLNSLLHPLIQQETQRQLASIDESYVLWVVPLLVENGLHHRANRVLVVDVAPEIQLARTMARDGITRQQAEHILASQVSRQQRLACADDIIDNSGDPLIIAPQVASLHQQYLKLAAATQQDLHQ